MAYRSFLILMLLLLPSGVSAAGPGPYIDALAAPDEVVLAPGGIGALNRAITASVEQMADVASMDDEAGGEQLSQWLSFEPLPGLDEPRFSASGEALGQGFFDSLRAKMALYDVAPSNPVAFGVVVERADVRAFPSDMAVIKRPGGFDTFQYSSIAPGEAVALLHRSADNEWGFFQTRFVRGWIRLDRVALGGRGLLGPDEGGGFIVVTGSAEVVYSDMALKSPAMALPMGSVLYLAGGQGGQEAPYYAVRIPAGSAEGLSWKTGYVDRRADVSEGFLPYTRRNIITQAFKMLGEGYGWGGEEGRRDCSAFIMDVFASVGIRLPRNSAQQGAAGVVRLAPGGASSPEAVARALAEADPGITLLALDGHIMLYLGVADGRPRVIHQIWGYMDAGGLNELKKVSVTGLDLGSGSGAGAFRERIRSASEVTLSPSLVSRSAAPGL